VHTLPEDQRKCAVCGGKLVPFSNEYITTRLCIIPAKIFKITYFREVYKCEHCDKHGDKAMIVKAPNLTPASVIPRGLPEAELIAYIAEAKYLLGEPLYRMEQHFKMQGIYLNRTSLANWIIKGSEWLVPVVKHFWKYAYLEPVLKLEVRQEEVRPIIEEFYNFIGTLRPSKGSHLGAAVTYALNQKDKLLLFLDHPEVEMTNNLAERTVKPFVIDRKNFLFSATDKGADASALFMSVIETAKRNGLNVFGYLSYLMLVLPSWGKTPSEEQLDSIMPWSATLPETCHRTYH